MSIPHLPALSEAPEAEEAAALFQRAHAKLGPTPLPMALRRLGASPVLFRDAMLNLDHALSERPPLPRADRLSIGVGLAAGIGAVGLSGWLDALAADAGVGDAHRRAAIEVALACRTLNAWYRAKHLLDVPGVLESQAHLRASPLVAAAIPKRLAELVCVGVSVAMACRSCATGHARAALDAGATAAEVDEVVRIQAVLVGLAPLDG